MGPISYQELSCWSYPAKIVPLGNSDWLCDWTCPLQASLSKCQLDECENRRIYIIELFLHADSDLKRKRSSCHHFLDNDQTQLCTLSFLLGSADDAGIFLDINGTSVSQNAAAKVLSAKIRKVARTWTAYVQSEFRLSAVNLRL
jgi:hypothetical protein